MQLISRNEARKMKLEPHIEQIFRVCVSEAVNALYRKTPALQTALQNILSVQVAYMTAAMNFSEIMTISSRLEETGQDRELICPEKLL
jgi:TRAP-type mannitol/chloroaromatic compound transport system substrate-binding protein